ncbi:uncharacterized protein [Periplaneta americana]|uniref:uncharacterized protein isoform X3 n=1 Tax=Periplaneta americana TaxID=6978 RepID=UPI0037E86E37
MCWRSRTPGVSGGHFRRWLHIDEDTIGPSNKQIHLISGEFFHGTDLLKRPPSERRQQEEEEMESLKTLQPTGDGSFEIQGSQINSTRPNSSGKLLQLTPLWEYVIKNQRIPPEIDKDVLFAEIAARLCDLEWEVRGHALRVLVDLIPVIELSELDRYMMPVLLRELTYNLGHSAPSVRKGALDSLGVYLTQSNDPETVLRNIVVEGLEKQTSTSASKGNIAMGVILSIPSLVNPLLTPTNGIVLISQTGLIHLVSALSKKLVQDTYQEQSLKTLVRIRHMVGEARFDRFLEGFHPQCKKDFDILCQVYDVAMNLDDSGIDLHVSQPGNDALLEGCNPDGWHGYWSDVSNRAASSSTISPEDALFRDQNQNLIILDDKSSSSENVADSSPSPKDEMMDDVDQGNEGINFARNDIEEYGHQTEIYDEEENRGGYENYVETYSEETMQINEGPAVEVMYAEDEDRGEHLEVEIEERAISQYENPEETEGAVTVIEGDAMDEEMLNSGRVILETEIKFNEDAAIMMTILEEGNKSPQDEYYPEESNVDQVDNNEKEPAADDEGYRVYNNNFVMKVLTDDEDYNDDDDVAVPDNPTRRTPRRVRFGGEMVMMRTPDSEEGNAQQEGVERQTTIEQQDGGEDSIPPQPEEEIGQLGNEDDVSADYIEATDAVQEDTESGAIQAIISEAAGEEEAHYVIEDTRQESVEEARRDSLVYTKENSVDEPSRRESISYAKDDDTLEESRRDSLVYTRQDTLDDAEHVDLSESRRNSIGFRRQDTIIERRQDSVEDSRRNSIQELRQDSTERRSSIQSIRQDSLEGERRGSVHDARLDSLDGIRRPSVQEIRQDSLESTRRASIQDIRRESIERKGSIQESRQDSTEARRRGSVQESRQDSTDSLKRRAIQEIRQVSIDETRQGQEAFTVEEGPDEELDSKLTSVMEEVGPNEPSEEMSSVSHIPLPVTPARNKPKDHKRRGTVYRKRQKGQNSQTSSESQEQSLDQVEDGHPKQESGESYSGSDADGKGGKTGAGEEDDSGDGKDDVEQPYLGQNWEELGIVTGSVLDDLHDEEEWVSRIHGIESLSTALKDPEVLHTVMPSMPSLLHCLLVTMAEDRNYRVATSSIGAVRGLIGSLPHAVLQDHLPQLVVGLTRHIGGSGSVNLKIETVQVAKALMQIMKPNPVVEILLTGDCIGAKSSKMRENSLLFLIYATLTFPSTEFHWDQMTARVAAAVADPRRRVRLAALDALSVIAQFATPSLLDEAVKSVADRQPNFATRIAYLAGVQARLSRRQLPTTSPDGLILYVLQIPSARTSGKGTFSTTPIGSDVDWVLAGSGSLSSGSARSRGQLIAAQRLDPQTALFPTPEESSSAPPKKGNRWTERKDIVAASVSIQSRAHSAGQQPLAPIGAEKTPDEQRPRAGISSWTADLDATQNSISSQSKLWFISNEGTFRPLLLRFQSPPELSNLNNDSVEKGSFSLLPNRLSQATLTGRGSEGVGHEKLNQTWPQPSSGRHSPRIPKRKSSKRGRRILEPLNGPNPHDGTSSQRGPSPGRKVSPARRGTSPAPRAVSPMPRAVSPIPRSVSPMPKAVSPVPRGVSPAARGVSPMRMGVNSGGRHKIPPLLSPRKKKDRVVDSGFIIADIRNDDIIDLSTIRRTRRRKRSTNKGKGIIAIEHDPLPIEDEHITLSPSIQGDTADDFTIPQKPMLARQGVRHELSQASILTENGGKISNGLFTPPAEPFLPPVDPATPPLSRAQTTPSPQQQDELEFKSLDENDEIVQEDQPDNEINSTLSAIDALEAEERALKFQLLKEQEQLESVTVSPISVASAPAVIENPVTTTEVIELDSNSRGSVSSLHNLQHSPPLLTHEESTEELNNDHQIPQPTYTTGSIIDLHLDVEDNHQNNVTVAPVKRIRRLKRGQVGAKNPTRILRGTQLRDTGRTQSNSSLFPDTLRPVEKPKDAMQQCFANLDNSEWEVTMQGLQLLVRLMRHHPETVHTHLHSVIVALAKQVRNLRSQVARAACQASGELFLSQKRALETDLDELASPLLHRTADTNRFLRADSNAALDKMVEVISPPRAVSVIVGKGASHQNAIVRTSSARLLVNLVSKVGVEKVMTYPGDMRDKILITGSNLLTEGSLDTRCFAKQLFRMLSTYPTFSSVMAEVIPSHVLRNISKTLQSLK